MEAMIIADLAELAKDMNEYTDFNLSVHNFIRRVSRLGKEKGYDFFLSLQSFLFFTRFPPPLRASYITHHHLLFALTAHFDQI